MNALKQTHSLALLILQQGQSDTGLFELEIPCPKKQDTKKIELPDIQQVVYIGTKKPSMPNDNSFQNVSTLSSVLTTATAAQSILLYQSISNYLNRWQYTKLL